MWWLVACTEPEPGKPEGVAPLPDPGVVALPSYAGRSLVYVHVDTLRADHLPFYGYARATTPRLSAAPWIQVDGIYAASSWTVPSTASLFTAEPPWVHGMTDLTRAGQDYIPIDAPTVAEHLRHNGWATAIFTGNYWIGEGSELRNGFDLVWYEGKNGKDYNSSLLNTALFEWLDALPEGQRFYAHVQALDMHQPYWVHPKDRGYWSEGEIPFDMDEESSTAQAEQITRSLYKDEEGTTRALNDVYDEELLGLDRNVGALMDGLEQRGLLDDVLFVFTADHGETLNDSGRGQFGHAQWLREELTRVPLLIRPPDGATVPDPVACVAPNARVLPTILEALHAPAFPGSGASLSEGCEQWAVSSLWGEPEELDQLNVSTGSERLTWDCTNRRVEAWDLAEDPSQLVSLDAADLPHGDVLGTALEDALVQIQARWPDARCRAP